jgi:hypothetical protein
VAEQVTSASVDAATTDGASRGSVASAGVTGGGIGTALAAYASILKDGSTPQALLTFSAPLVSIGVGGLWLFLKIIWIDPFMVKRKDQAREKQAQALEQRLRTDLQRKIADPATSAQMQVEYQAALDQLDKAYLASICGRMAGLGATPGE